MLPGVACDARPPSATLVARLFARAMFPGDKILDPQRLIPLGGNAPRLQAARPVAHLRVIEDVSTALREDRKEKIPLPLLKEEFAVDSCIDVHQLDGARELVMTLPHAVDRDDPGVVLGLDDLAGEYILRAVETGFGRDGVACTGFR